MHNAAWHSQSGVPDWNCVAHNILVIRCLIPTGVAASCKVSVEWMCSVDFCIVLSFLYVNKSVLETVLHSLKCRWRMPFVMSIEIWITCVHRVSRGAPSASPWTAGDGYICASHRLPQYYLRRSIKSTLRFMIIFWKSLQMYTLPHTPHTFHHQHYYMHVNSLFSYPNLCFEPHWKSSNYNN